MLEFVFNFMSGTWFKEQVLADFYSLLIWTLTCFTVGFLIGRNYQKLISQPRSNLKCSLFQRIKTYLSSCFHMSRNFKTLSLGAKSLLLIALKHRFLEVPYETSYGYSEVLDFIQQETASLAAIGFLEKTYSGSVVEAYTLPWRVKHYLKHLAPDLLQDEKIQDAIEVLQAELHS